MPEPATASSRNHARTRWAMPHSGHDRVVRVLRRGLPVGIVALVGAMMAAPVLSSGDLSFVLSKDRVAVAHERMRVQAATYRGEDSHGQPFTLRAGSAVQQTSRDPVVKMHDLSGEIMLSGGKANIVAQQGRYDMDKETVSIDGPLAFRSADGYRLDTRDVDISLNDRTISSNGAVDGAMRLGTFSAGHIRVDLTARTVILDGRARLNIVQGVSR